MARTYTSTFRPDGETLLQALVTACQEGSESAYKHWIQASLPALLSVSAYFFEQQEHREAVCRDTLLLAWRNISCKSNAHKPQQWLYGILGSRLYSQLLALHGSQDAVQEQVATLTEERAGVNSPTGLRPAALDAKALATMSNRVPFEPPSQRLIAELETLIQAEIAQRQAPLTPTGERVYPPLYDSSLQPRMLRSRAAFRLKESFKRSMGRPLEDKLFRRWLDGKLGSLWLEEQGLPRRSVEAYAGERLNLEIDPAVLTKGLDYPASFPNRTLRRKVSNLFLWSGNWDLTTPTLADTQRQRYITDIWTHRLDLTASGSYTYLMAKLAEGTPLRSHHQGILLDSEARIRTYLDRYRLYMEDMLCFGFKPSLGKDPLGIVVGRHGNLIKSNKGLHRIAMAQTLGLQRVTVRVRALHQHWWERHKGNANGREALDKVLAALPSPCKASSNYGICLDKKHDNSLT